MMILNCKVRAAIYSIYHDLNNRVERRLRLSAYIYDEEGCVYPDKSAKKTPLDIKKLRSMFILNPNILNPVLIDNKEERKREETRLHKKPRYKGGFPKEIKMGQILMPPYYWHKMGEDSTFDPLQRGLVEEVTHKQQTTSTQTHQQQDSSTLGSRRSELVEKRVEQRLTVPLQTMRQDRWRKNHRVSEDKSHADINALMIANQDQRSILISDEETSQGIGPIDDNFYKRKSVFERLGKSTTNPSNTYANTIKNNRPYQDGNEQANNKRPKLSLNNTQTDAHDRHHMKNQQNQAYSPQSQAQLKVVQQDKQTQNKFPVNSKYNSDHNNNQYKYNDKSREPERYGRDGKGENAHNSNTSRESHQNRQHYQDKQGSNAQLYNKWSHKNNQNNRQNNQVSNRQVYNNKSNE